MSNNKNTTLLPDFLIIGAQKSGTTTLFALLRKHHFIYLPLQKEVQFFSSNEFYDKGLENLEFRRALERSIEASDKDVVLFGSSAYYQFSVYADILAEYLRLILKENFLIPFQKDLNRRPKTVLKSIHDFLGVKHNLPEKPDIRLHTACSIKRQWLDNLVKHFSMIRSFLNHIFPSGFRGAIKFWAEQTNFKHTAPKTIPADVLSDFYWIVTKQADFLKTQFDVTTPWTQSDSLHE